jgi:hypothetical protein
MELIFNQESNKKGEGKGEERKKKGDLVIVYNYKSGWVVVVVVWVGFFY